MQKPVVKIRTSSDASNGDGTRAQQRVRQQFEEIDAGRLDARSVFSQVSGASVASAWFQVSDAKVKADHGYHGMDAKLGRPVSVVGIYRF